MLGWIISKFVGEKDSTPTEKQYTAVEVYARSSVPVTDLNHAVDISMVLGAHQVMHWGIKPAPGVYIARSQYEAMPNDLKKYFEKTTVMMEIIP